MLLREPRVNGYYHPPYREVSIFGRS